MWASVPRVAELIYAGQRFDIGFNAGLISGLKLLIEDVAANGGAVWLSGRVAPDQTGLLLISAGIPIQLVTHPGFEFLSDIDQIVDALQDGLAQDFASDVGAWLRAKSDDGGV